MSSSMSTVDFSSDDTQVSSPEALSPSSPSPSTPTTESDSYDRLGVLLPNGTDVTAKLKGKGFCEAKIKAIDEIHVMIRVTLKSGSSVIIDEKDIVEGDLCVGAKVRVRHGGKPHRKATITEINDASTYVVDFFHGDEEIHKRKNIRILSPNRSKPEPIEESLRHPEHLVKSERQRSPAGPLKKSQKKQSVQKRKSSSTTNGVKHAEEEQESHRSPPKKGSFHRSEDEKIRKDVALAAEQCRKLMKSKVDCVSLRDSTPEDYDRDSGSDDEESEDEAIETGYQSVDTNTESMNDTTDLNERTSTSTRSIPQKKRKRKKQVTSYKFSLEKSVKKKKVNASPVDVNVSACVLVWPKEDKYVPYIPNYSKERETFNGLSGCPACFKLHPYSTFGKNDTRAAYSPKYYRHCLEECTFFKEQGKILKCHKCFHKFLNQEDLKGHKRRCHELRLKAEHIKSLHPHVNTKQFFHCFYDLHNKMNTVKPCVGCKKLFPAYEYKSVVNPSLQLYYHQIDCVKISANLRSQVKTCEKCGYRYANQADYEKYDDCFISLNN